MEKVMSTKKTQEQLNAATAELARAEERLTTARSELDAATDRYTKTRSDAEWDAKQACEAKVQRFTLDVHGLKAEHEKARRTHAEAVVSDYQTKLAAAAATADLDRLWGPLLEEAHQLYAALGELRNRVVRASQSAREAVSSFDALSGEATEFARVNGVASPTVPTIRRQPPGVLTLEVFRNALGSKLAGAIDSRGLMVPMGEGIHAPGHLHWMAAHHGVTASDDIVGWEEKMRVQQLAETEARLARIRQEAAEREAKQHAEHAAKLQRERENLIAEGFDTSDIPMPATYN